MRSWRFRAATVAYAEEGAEGAVREGAAYIVGTAVTILAAETGPFARQLANSPRSRCSLSKSVESVIDDEANKSFRATSPALHVNSRSDIQIQRGTTLRAQRETKQNAKPRSSLILDQAIEFNSLQYQNHETQKQLPKIHVHRLHY